MLAKDETDLMMFPPLRMGWSPRGELAKIALQTGTRVLLPRSKNRIADYRAFLAEVRSRYRERHIALLLDEGPNHTVKASQREAEGLTLLWLPNRTPELNTLWG